MHCYVTFIVWVSINCWCKWSLDCIVWQRRTCISGRCWKCLRVIIWVDEWLLKLRLLWRQKWCLGECASCIAIYCGYKFSCKSTTQLKNYACHLLKTNIVIYMMTHLPFIRLHFLSHNVRNVLSKWRCVLRRHGLALSK